MISLLNRLRIVLIGFCMGAADLVPGVSGGTVAFIGGIYDRLINGLKSLDVVTLRLLLKGRLAEVFERVPVVFFLTLGVGMITAILSLSHPLAGLFKSHPVQLWTFFFGLVLGSILLLAKETWRWRASDWIAFITATAITYWVVGLHSMQTPPTLPLLFLSGAIAICAMILPGISGSYILVIMGKYQQVLEALNNRDFVALGVFIAGIIVGILSFVRLVSWLLRKWRQVTLVALTGIMAGALRTVWPWKQIIATRINSHGEEVPLTQINVLPDAGASAFVTALPWLVAGLVAVVLLSRLNPPAEKTPPTGSAD
jgi:putative membrane protein